MSTSAEKQNEETVASVPGSWSRVRLSDICEIVRGVSYKKEQASEQPAKGLVPILRATNIQDSALVLDADLVYVPSAVVSDEQILRVGDIVVATSSGSKHLVGKTAQVKESWRGSFGAFCAALRPKTEINYRYLGYFFGSQEYKNYIREKALGVNINNLRRGDLEEISVPLAPFDQQKRIVAEIEKQFSRLDEAVANLKRVKANLKRYKAAVLKAAVEGRLVETEAELARREGRSYETGAQLLQRILETRRSQWKGKGKYKEPAAPDTTDLPELPEAWVWATVETICAQIVDCPHSTPRFQEIGYPCIDTTWMTAEGLVIQRARFVDQSAYQERIARLEPEPGDIVFAREGTIGTANVIPDRMKPCLGQRVMLLRTSVLFSNRLLMHTLHSEVVKAQYQAQALGSTVPHINVADVKRFAIPVPPLAEQQRIVAEIDRRGSLAHEVESQVEANLKRSERLRQSVLAGMFSPVRKPKSNSPNVGEPTSQTGEFNEAN